MTKFLMIFVAAAAFAGSNDPTAESSPEAACAVSGKKPEKVSASQNGQTLRGLATDAPESCKQAIKVEVGAAGRAAADHAINTKGTGTGAGRAAADHAINTKGAGAAARCSSAEGKQEKESISTSGDPRLDSGVEGRLLESIQDECKGFSSLIR